LGSTAISYEISDIEIEAGAEAQARNCAMRAHSIVAYLLDANRQPGVGWQNT
jgi:hypothetical protein